MLANQAQRIDGIEWIQGIRLSTDFILALAACLSARMPFPRLDRVRLWVEIGVGELIALLATFARVDAVGARKPNATGSGIDARGAERSLLTIRDRILHAPIAVCLVFEKVRQRGLGDVIEQS